MGRRRDPVEVVRTEGADRFAFLVSAAGFEGPEPTGHGIAYQRADCRVETGFFAGYAGEQEGATRLVLYDEAGRRHTSIPLEKAQAACGCSGSSRPRRPAPTAADRARRVPAVCSAGTSWAWPSWSSCTVPSPSARPPGPSLVCRALSAPRGRRSPPTRALMRRISR